MSPGAGIPTWFGLYPVVLVLAYTLGRLVASWPIPIRSLLTSGLSVVLMTWAVMPLVTKVLPTVAAAGHALTGPVPSWTAARPTLQARVGIWPMFAGQT